MDELAHTINVILDKRIVQSISDLCDPLFYVYNDLRNFKPNPHLTIATKFCDASKTKDFVAALQNEFKNDKPWELEFSDFSISGNYLFLSINELSEAKMNELHDRALTCTEGIGTEGIGGQPSKYPYQAHISLIKLEEGDLKDALGLLKHNLSGVKATISGYEITVEKRGGKLLTFPTAAEISLN